LYSKPESSSTIFGLHVPGRDQDRLNQHCRIGGVALDAVAEAGNGGAALSRQAIGMALAPVLTSTARTIEESIWLRSM
jgi:hypothetical protein